jgi:hydroxyacylglutathione hydrolase
VNVEIFKQGTDNWGYILRNAQNKCLLLDPLDANLYEKKIRSLKLTPIAILLTHYHQDHIAGVPELLKKFSIPVLGPEDNEQTPKIVTDKVAGEIQLLENTVFCYTMPGHTRALNTYHFKKSKQLFVGDLLFNLGCGRVFEGTHEQHYASLQHLKELPINTEIFVGHDYREKNLNFAKKLDPNFYSALQLEDLQESTSLEMELWWNPFLKAPSFEAWKRLRDLRDQS